MRQPEAATTPTPVDATGAPAAPGLVAARAARGGVFLLLRQIVVTLVNIGGGVALAHLLVPGEYGVYAVVILLASFGSSVGDLGLGASLIRQEMEPTRKEIAQVFTAQVGLGTGLAVAIWCLAPTAASWYSSRYVTPGLLRWASPVVLLLALRTVPSCLLDRHLQFGRVAAVETLQVLLFNGLAIAGAAAGWGGSALPVALFCQTLVGSVLLWVLKPVRVGLTLDYEGMSERMRFGLFFQASSVVSYFKDAISPLLIGLLLGSAAVGLTEWAETYATYCLLAMMILQRVYLPMFARLHDSPESLRRGLEVVIRLGNVVVAPLAVLSVALAVPGVRLIFGAKWVPGLHLMYLLALANVFVPTVAPLMAVLNAKGRSGTTLVFSLVWMLLTWVVGAPLVAAIGLVGYGCANIVAVLSNIAIIIWVRRSIPFSLAGVAMIWVRASLVGAAILIARHALPPDSLWSLGTYALIGLLSFGALVVATDPVTVQMARRVPWRRPA